MITITLQHPVPFEGGELKEITLRRPIVKDGIAADKYSENELEKKAMLISKMAGLPIDPILELSFSDMSKIAEAVESFSQ